MDTSIQSAKASKQLPVDVKGYNQLIDRLGRAEVIVYSSGGRRHTLTPLQLYTVCFLAERDKAGGASYWSYAKYLASLGKRGASGMVFRLFNGLKGLGLIDITIQPGERRPVNVARLSDEGVRIYGEIRRELRAKYDERRSYIT